MFWLHTIKLNCHFLFKQFAELYGLFVELKAFRSSNHIKLTLNIVETLSYNK